MVTTTRSTLTPYEQTALPGSCWLRSKLQSQRFQNEYCPNTVAGLRQAAVRQTGKPISRAEHFVAVQRFPRFVVMSRLGQPAKISIRCPLTGTLIESAGFVEIHFWRLQKESNWLSLVRILAFPRALCGRFLMNVSSADSSRSVIFLPANALPTIRIFDFNS
jgi:hypothetical protein